MILAIPLDDQYPPPHMLMRRFDGGDDRILAYDPGLGQWRHVPDLATFQALGYYWCNVTAADAGFFDRITLGPPYPASTVPARDDYPFVRRRGRRLSSPPGGQSRRGVLSRRPGLGRGSLTLTLTPAPRERPGCVAPQ